MPATMFMFEHVLRIGTEENCKLITRSTKAGTRVTRNKTQRIMTSQAYKFTVMNCTSTLTAVTILPLPSLLWFGEAHIIVPVKSGLLHNVTYHAHRPVLLEVARLHPRV